MFDPIGSFSRQFIPVDGGYLYHPSHTSGGRLVTVEEYEALMADWRRFAGPGGVLKIAGLVFIVIISWVIAEAIWSFPEWAGEVLMAACVAAVAAAALRAGLAPRR